MAGRLLSSSSPLSHLLPTFLPPTPSIVAVTSVRLSTFLSRPLFHTPALVIPISANVTIPSLSSLPSLPSLLSDIWESVLRAVPKKKTSHRKKRQRFLAGKALKDAKNLNSCPACGRVKKAHTLCPHCVSDIRQMWSEAEDALYEDEMQHDEAQQNEAKQGDKKANPI